MNSAQARALRIPRNIWSWIRQVSGDAAYENYLRSTRRVEDVARAVACEKNAEHQAHATSAVPLTREEFYLHALRRRYSTISRCC
jgi:uncharacterized short protein YbdD (DUF466 family)